MKKRYVILIIAIIVAVLGLTGFLVYSSLNQGERDYTVEKVENYEYFALKKDGKFGVMDREGKIVITAKYDSVKIPNPQKDVFFCYTDNQTRILNSKEEEILTNYSNVEPIKLSNVVSDLLYEKSVLKYQKDGKYGLIDFEGKQVADTKYDSIENLPYKEGELLVKQQEKYGVINIKGITLVEIKYDSIKIDDFYNSDNQYKDAGYIVCITSDEGYRYGYVDINGEELIKPEYNELSRITEIEDPNTPYFILAKNGQYGVFNGKNELIKNEYQSIKYDLNNKLFIIEKSKKYGVFDITGKTIVPIEYSQIDITGKYLYVKDENGTTKVLDTNGKQVDLSSDISILKTSNDNYQIKIKNENNQINYGVIDKNNKELIPLKYSYIEYLFDNYFKVCDTNGKLGILNDKEEKIIDFQYDTIQKIEGTKLVQVANITTKFTEVYSSKIKKICEMQNANIGNETTNDYISIYNDSEIKYISKTTETEIENTEAYTKNTLFAKQDNGKWGFADSMGTMKIEAKYDKVTEFNVYGFAGVKKDGKWGVVNKSGEVILEPKYTLTKDPVFIGEYYQVEYGFGEKYYTNETK